MSDMPCIEEFTAEFFKNSSEEWRKNKIQKKDSTFVYRCTHVLSEGKRCSKQVKNTDTMLCWCHRNYKYPPVA